MYLYFLLNYLSCYCFRHCPEWRNSHVVNVAVDGLQLDCMKHDAVMDELHIVHSMQVDHETCTDDSFHAAEGKKMPSSPVVLVLD